MVELSHGLWIGLVALVQVKELGLNSLIGRVMTILKLLESLGQQHLALINKSQEFVLFQLEISLYLLQLRPQLFSLYHGSSELFFRSVVVETKNWFFFLSSASFCLRSKYLFSMALSNSTIDLLASSNSFSISFRQASALMIFSLDDPTNSEV